MRPRLPIAGSAGSVRSARLPPPSTLPRCATTAGGVRIAADWQQGYAVTTAHSVQQYDPVLGYVVGCSGWPSRFGLLH